MSEIEPITKDIVQYIMGSDKKSQSKIKKDINAILNKHYDTLSSNISQVKEPETTTTGFQLMCCYKEPEISKTIPYSITKTDMKLIMSYLWGRKSDKINNSQVIQNIKDKFSITPLSDVEKKKFSKLARKTNKKFKSKDGSQSKPKSNPYLKMCADIRPKIVKISGLENKDYMKVMGYMWSGKLSENMEDRIKNIIKKNKIKALTDKEKEKYKS